MKILIVEDDTLQAQELHNKLIDLDYEEIIVAHESMTALSLFKKEIPDLVILDIGLTNSNQNGIAVAQQIKEIKPTPTIFLSSYSDDETVNKARSVGYSHYLLKPVHVRQLGIAIEDALSSNSVVIGGDRQANSKHIICPLVQEPQSFFVKGNGKAYERVNVADILWVTTNNPIIEIQTIYKKHTSSCQLGTFAIQIRHSQLLRIHASHIVNVDYVLKVDENNVFILHNEILFDFKISKSYKNKIDDQLLYLRSKIVS